jgi:hypothetical protein
MLWLAIDWPVIDRSVIDRSAIDKSVIDAALEIYAALGVMLVAHHFGMHASQVKVGGAVFAAAGKDYLGFCGLSQQGLHDWFHWQQF